MPQGNERAVAASTASSTSNALKEFVPPQPNNNLNGQLFEAADINSRNSQQPGQVAPSANGNGVQSNNVRRPSRDRALTSSDGTTKGIGGGCGPVALRRSNSKESVAPQLPTAGATRNAPVRTNSPQQPMNNNNNKNNNGESCNGDGRSGESPPLPAMGLGSPMQTQQTARDRSMVNGANKPNFNAPRRLAIDNFDPFNTSSAKQTSMVRPSSESIDSQTFEANGEGINVIAPPPESAIGGIGAVNGRHQQQGVV